MRGGERGGVAIQVSTNATTDDPSRRLRVHIALRSTGGPLFQPSKPVLGGNKPVRDAPPLFSGNFLGNKAVRAAAWVRWLGLVGSGISWPAWGPVAGCALTFF